MRVRQRLDEGSLVPAASKGRGPNGRFAPGWKGGPGNPFIAVQNKMRTEFIAAISNRDIERAVQVLRDVMDNAEKDADRLAAVKLLLDRTMGAVPLPEPPGQQSVFGAGAQVAIVHGLDYSQAKPELILEARRALWELEQSLKAKPLDAESESTPSENR